MQSLSSAQRQQLAASLTDEEAAALLCEWRLWARPDQLPPEDDEWLTWLILSGRGWGKTRVGSETTIRAIRDGRAKRIALVGETAADCRDVMVEGDSGIIACSPPDFRPVYEPSKRRLTWPNGAIAYTYNATQPGQLRGPQHDWAWSDELAKWMYAQDTWDQLQFGLRLGTQPRQIVTTTPRPIPIIRELIQDSTVRVTRGRTIDNAANLADTFVKQIMKRYSGTRLGRQELDGDILDDAPGALWTREMIDRCLVTEHPPLVRVTVAVDPSGTAGSEDDGDSVGIVVAGVCDRGLGWVLLDRTCKLSPAMWGATVISSYHECRADRIVAERNFGGAMVEHVLRTIDPTIPYREVHASRGKFIRAEPVSALYEQGRVRHVGSKPELEDQMCLLTRDGYIGRGSPDRLDALVWAITDLMLEDEVPHVVVGSY